MKHLDNQQRLDIRLCPIYVAVCRFATSLTTKYWRSDISASIRKLLSGSLPRRLTDLGFVHHKNTLGLRFHKSRCVIHERSILGKGNFKALFEALELEQDRRWNL